MTVAELSKMTSFLTPDRFVSIREIQKSPTKVLTGIKLVMNGSKPKGIYMDMKQRQERWYDLEKIQSELFKTNN